MTRDETVDEVVRRLVEHYRPERIYLFGSSARVTPAPRAIWTSLLFCQIRRRASGFLTKEYQTTFGIFHLG